MNGKTAENHLVFLPWKTRKWPYASVYGFFCFYRIIHRYVVDNIFYGVYDPLLIPKSKFYRMTEFSRTRNATHKRLTKGATSVFLRETYARVFLSFSMYNVEYRVKTFSFSLIPCWFRTHTVYACQNVGLCPSLFVPGVHRSTTVVGAS